MSRHSRLSELGLVPCLLLASPSLRVCTRGTVTLPRSERLLLARRLTKLPRKRGSMPRRREHFAKLGAAP